MLKEVSQAFDTVPRLCGSDCNELWSQEYPIRYPQNHIIHRKPVPASRIEDASLRNSTRKVGCSDASAALLMSGRQKDVLATLGRRSSSPEPANESLAGQ